MKIGSPWSQFQKKIGGISLSVENNSSQKSLHIVQCHERMASDAQECVV